MTQGPIPFVSLDNLLILHHVVLWSSAVEIFWQMFATYRAYGRTYGGVDAARVVKNFFVDLLTLFFSTIKILCDKLKSKGKTHYNLSKTNWSRWCFHFKVTIQKITSFPLQSSIFHLEMNGWQGPDTTHGAECYWDHGIHQLTTLPLSFQQTMIAM